MDKSEQISSILWNINFNLVILTIFCRKFDLYSLFKDLAFFQLLMAKFGLLNFIGHGNPVP